MSPFTTCLWFDGNAAEAAEFYVSVFADLPGGARITGTEHYPEGGHLPAGTVLTVNFEIAGQRFLALNGGPVFSFSEAVSLQVPCRDQAEIDHYWAALLADGGQESQCGWLKDRFGFSWQVVPDGPIFRAEDSPETNARVNTALMAMRKIDLAALDAARRGDDA
ncbi:putative 3-demethylubiquinone-9 3-methyltransferase (glyoxalase superfamily) [Salana multivorans]|uniref:Putative 3-demethylubiquinone-9 3-methyltransferase (Glyoxalase superfamily) n=1 Tax=Salana multivorans TaxID=120377 RepID=A0A3N2DB62_9MICO|nr:VOC family protein [Salana multivorans]ROR96898.1 putative 3-demethylubiquinone-9 3-methyltransferase (glyoxalase superfamily) [Salana multivorans]